MSMMNKSKSKIGIFISSYKSMQTLPEVIDRIPANIKKSASEIFVIDDASPDNSYKIAIAYKKRVNLPNLTIMKNTKNRGFGGNQKEAFNYAIQKGYDLIIVLHGDAQYAPEELNNFIDEFEKSNSDLVYGSRMLGDPLGGGMPMWRYLGNKFLTIIQNSILNLGLTEYHSGYRAYKCEALKKISFNKLSNDYYFDPEILVLSKIHKFKISEVPIPTHYGPESLSPSIWVTFKYFLFTLKSLLDYKLHSLGLIKYKTTISD